MDRQNPVKDTGSSMHNAELHNHHFCLFGFFILGLLYSTHELVETVKGTFQSSLGLIKFPMNVAR